MKVLITGGAGFIGSLLVDRLVEKGNEVVVVDNFSTGKKENLNSSMKFYDLDISDHEKLNAVFVLENPELVLHLAANALLRKSIEDPLYDARCNILGTISVLECCRKNDVKKIIYTSTGGARVGDPEYLPVDENHPLNPCSPYGISKHSAEHYFWTYNKLYGIEYFIFCFGNVYGIRDDSSTGRLIPFFVNKILNRENPKIFGDGNQTRDFIYVEDLVDFMINSINKIGTTEHKLFHLANGMQISVNEVVRLLREISEKNFEVERIQAIKGEVRDIVLDISLAQKELDWSPRTHIKEGLAKTWAWFEKENVQKGF
jgi:UDP-glucose 4-epimerase